eukprot:88208-Chlamydomonas_euryale.AAC.1
MYAEGRRRYALQLPVGGGAFGGRRLAVWRSVFGGRRLAVGVWRFGGRRLAVGVRRSALGGRCVRRSVLGGCRLEWRSALKARGVGSCLCGTTTPRSLTRRGRWRRNSPGSPIRPVCQAAGGLSSMIYRLSLISSDRTGLPTVSDFMYMMMIDFTTAHHPPLQHNTSGVDLHAKRGSLTMVIGSVGSGKSSLLSALVGHMNRCAEYVGAVWECVGAVWGMCGGGVGNGVGKKIH